MAHKASNTATRRRLGSNNARRSPLRAREFWLKPRRERGLAEISALRRGVRRVVARARLPSPSSGHGSSGVGFCGTRGIERARRRSRRARYSSAERFAEDRGDSNRGHGVQVARCRLASARLYPPRRSRRSRSGADARQRLQGSVVPRLSDGLRLHGRSHDRSRCADRARGQPSPGPRPAVTVSVCLRARDLAAIPARAESPRARKE
jgi:hypothetical protein